MKKFNTFVLVRYFLFWSDIFFCFLRIQSNLYDTNLNNIKKIEIERFCSMPDETHQTQIGFSKTAELSSLAAWDADIKLNELKQMHYSNIDA